MAFELGLSRLVPSSWSTFQVIVLAVSAPLSFLAVFLFVSVLSARRASRGRPQLASRLLARLLPMVGVAAVLCILMGVAFAAPNVNVSPADSFILQFGMAAVFTLLTVVTAVVVRWELRPASQIADAAACLARNELDTSVPMEVSRRSDELGRLSQAIQRITIGLGVGMDEIAHLVEVSQAISARTPLSQSLPVLLRGVLRGVNARAAGIYLVEGEQGVLRSVASEGDLFLPAAVEGSIEHFTRQVWRTASPSLQPQVGSGATGAGREALDQSEVRALAVFPMLREGRTIGALWVAWDAPREFSPMDRNFLATLANLAGIMVESYDTYRTARIAEGRLGALLANSHEGILIADGDGRLKIANPVAEQLLGFNMKDREGAPIQTVLNHEQVYRMIADLLRDRGLSVVEVERGERRLHISGTRLKNSDQNTTQGWVFVLRDETEAHRTDMSQNGVLGLLAHSMATPATCVRGYASMLNSAGPINEAQEKYVHNIIRGVDDLTQIIDEYRTMSAIASGRDVTRTPVQITNLAIKVANAMATYIEGKGLALRTEFSRDVPKIIGDPGLLEHAIRNLVDNAIKYTNAPGWIKLSVQESPSSVLVTVADSGIGIPQAFLRRVFEPGVRVKSRETAHISGTGNGLAIVKRIVDQHGGQVWVESQVSVGSTFHIAIPKDRSIADLLGEEPPAADTMPAPKPESQPTEQPVKRGREAGLYL